MATEPTITVSLLGTKAIADLIDLVKSLNDDLMYVRREQDKLRSQLQEAIAERERTIQRMSDQYCEAVQERDEAERELKLAIEELQRLQAGSDGPCPK